MGDVVAVAGPGSDGGVKDPSRFWPGRRVLITGAAGLLGGWVAHDLLEAGAEVIGFDIDWAAAPMKRSKGLRVVDGDVRDLEQVRLVLEPAPGPDVVIHLAAQPIVQQANDDPIPTFEHNIAGTWTVLEACRLAERAPGVLVASSDKAYGEGGGQAYEESMPLGARHPYAVSKACTDLIAQTYAESYGLPVVITRCGNIYGGGDFNWSRIVPGTIRSVLEGERPVIRSDGTPVRDYLYVEDVAAGVLALSRAIVEQPDLAGDAFNLGGGDRVSVLELVRMILKLMETNLEPDIRNQAVNEITEQRVGAEKARRVLGWGPSTPLDEGLPKTIAWYVQYLRASP